ncbi:pPE family protein [Mycobacterium kansasii]|uniref:PPE family protein n=1 Tax=Mycobacterium kansasii TaxID=1768 RepID=A0A1V3XW03_MYCKA|nr:pPE family protein [Mycobacterium kansasii]
MREALEMPHQLGYRKQRPLRRPKSKLRLPAASIAERGSGDCRESGPVPVARVTQSTGSGIPESALRPSRTADVSHRSANTQDQASEAEEKVVSLRPEAEKGKLRPRAKQEPGIQMRGG